MSKSRAEQIREQARGARETETAPPVDAEQGPRSGVRVPPVRVTVDFPANRHNDLKDWCNETARELGKSRVTSKDVIMALVGRVLTDETLARKIRADLALNERT